MSAYIGGVASWMRSNCLQLNIAKTEFLWSTTGRRLHELPQSPLGAGSDHFTSFCRSRHSNIHRQWCLDEVSRHENGVDLLLGTASTADYPWVSVEICFSVADVVSRPLTAGLQQFYTYRRFITTVVTAAVIDKRHRSAYLYLVKVPAHYSDSSSAALTEGFIADCIQTGSPGVQVYRCLHGSAPA